MAQSTTRRIGAVQAGYSRALAKGQRITVRASQIMHDVNDLLLLLCYPDC
jgi:hypothetical protein